MIESPLIIALDTDIKSSLKILEGIDPLDCKVKVGSQLFTTSGPKAVEKLNELGFDVFLDLKFHDIPNTVKKSIEAAIKMGVWMVNVHSLGGKEMLKTAYKAIEKAEIKPLLIGVTILTSFHKQDLKQLGLQLDVEDQVLLLAKLCQSQGLDGIVCSPRELSILRENFDEDFLLVTPGIRSTGIKKDDQKRTSTAKQAIVKGANYVVIGREVTNHNDPRQKINQILKELQS